MRLSICISGGRGGRGELTTCPKNNLEETNISSKIASKTKDGVHASAQ